MARIRVRFVINQGRHGAPMTKLGKISEQAENFSKRWRLIARLKAILANGSR